MKLEDAFNFYFNGKIKFDKFYTLGVAPDYIKN